MPNPIIILSSAAEVAATSLPQQVKRRLKAQKLSFVHSAQGYAKVYIYEDGATWLEFIKVSADNQTGEVCFRKQLKAGTPQQPSEALTNNYPPITKDSMTDVGGDIYGAGMVKRFFMGKQFRNSLGRTYQSKRARFK